MEEEGDWAEYRRAMMEGRYFEAHEILEVPWRRSRDHRLQIAIWIAAAFVHWTREQPIGAIRLFTRILNDPEAEDLPIRHTIERWIRAVDAGENPRAPTAGEFHRLRLWAWESE